ncbi:hypothetical protein KDA08_02850 [Candidatus Saccharibacteria bacterium]|nr:hypothetical protein [Candidatus Saccharibacteria bacterium]
MLTLNSGFEHQIRLKNPNRIIIAKLYYDDESAFTSIATRTTIIDGVQYHGLVTRFSSPKSTWNWDGENNVVVTTPTLEIGNFESAAKGTSLLDEFYSKNYLGRKVELYMTFQGATTANDTQQIYSGRVEDLKFSEGKISVLFKATDMPTNDIAGRLIDYETKKVGTITAPAMPEDVNALRIPVVYGKVWDAPGVCVQYEEQYVDYDKKYIFHDKSKLSNITSNDATLVSSARKHTARTEPLMYILDNDYLVPISSYDVSTSGTNLWTYTDTTYSGLTVTFDTSSGQQSYLDNTIASAVPLRLGERARSTFGAGTINVSGSITEISDGDLDTYLSFQTLGANADTAYVYFTTDENIVTYNLKYMIDGEGIYGFHSARPIHVGDKDQADTTPFYGRVDFIYSNQPASNTYRRWHFETTVFGKDGATVIGGRNLAISNRTIQWYYPQAYPLSYERGCGVAAGAWAGSYVPSGLGEIADWLQSFSTGAFSYDATLSFRESLDNFKLRVKVSAEHPVNTSYSHIYRWHDWFMLASKGIDLPKDYIYSEVQGPLISDSSDFVSLASGTNVPLKRPYHYIEAMLRNIGFGTSDFDVDSWEALDTLWGDTFWDRRDFSGFVITESTPFDEFIKEYLQYETFSIYREDSGKFRAIILKDSYSAADAVIDFNKCISFEMGISPLKNVVTNINSLKIDKQYFSDGYTYNNSWNIATSGGYSYGFYDYTNDETTGIFTMKEMVKQYTSHSRNTCVLYTGVSYTVRKDHTSGDVDSYYGDAFIPTNDVFYTETNYFAKDRVWESGLAYTCESAEAYHIARRYLNQFGNRHRTIKLTSNDMDFYKFQIGDVVSFENVPDTLLGMSISGFGGSTASSATLNGQTVYPYFMVYSILKDGQKVEMECFQLHKLDDLVIKRGASVAS